MATEKKTKKDKELENQIRDVRQQLTEQLRCLDQRVDCHLGLVWELQEYYRRHAEVELESSRGLDKLGKQISTRHKAEKQRREMWPNFSTYETWQMLLSATKNRSREYAALAEIYGTLMVNRLGDLIEDIQRVHKKCRDILTLYQEELVKVLNELLSAMRTYHAYHGESQQAESKLLRVQSQRFKEDQTRSIGRRFKNYEKESEKKQAKYMDNKLKALKARNDYLLAIDAANAAVRKYFEEHLPLLVEKMDTGYYILLGHVTDLHVQTEECLMLGQQARLDSMRKHVVSLKNPADRNRFHTLYAKIFATPECFEFQPHNGDEIRQLSAQKNIQDEMVDRLKTIKDRLDKEKADYQSMAKSLVVSDLALMEKLNQCGESDISQLFHDDKPPIKSPTDKDKKNKERIDAEEYYLNQIDGYLRAGNLVSRLQAKFNLLQKAVGDVDVPAAVTADALRTPDTIPKRPPSLPPKPRKSKASSTGQQAPKLFGGSLEEYITKTGQPIPQVVLSCVKAINLYGMHHQGIFRIPGSQNDINAYKNQFEQGEDPLDGKVDGDDINSVAGLLKLYFRELKDSAFPSSIFDQLIECSSKYNINDPSQELEWKSAVKACLSSLSPAVNGVLRYLFAFLNHVSEYSDENMMDASNLAICFGPTLLPVPSGRDPVQFQTYVNELIKNVIVHFESVFPFDGDVQYEKCIVEDDREKDYGDAASDDEILSGGGAAGEDDDEQSPDKADESPGIDEQEAVALFDFAGRTKRELSFMKGDVIKLTQRRSVDWWDGVVNGKAGLVPDKYIRLNPKKRKEKESSSLKGGLSGGFAMMLDEKLRKSTESLLSLGSHSSSSKSTVEKAASHSNLPTSSQLQQQPPIKEDLAVSIDNTLAKVLSGIKTLDQIQPTPSPGSAQKSSEISDKSASSSNVSTTVVPIVVKPPSPTADDSEAFPSFSRNKTKASTLPKISANDDLKTFGTASDSQKKLDVSKTRSLTYAEGKVVGSVIAEHEAGTKDDDSTSSPRAPSTLPRPTQTGIPATIPTVPSSTAQPPTPTGASAPVVPPKPVFVKKPTTSSGTSPQLARSSDTSSRTLPAPSAAAAAAALKK